jgi:lysophospholipase
MLDAVLHITNLRGLILETFGAGNAPSGADNILTTIIASAIARGIVIVNVSQCLAGSVSPLYAPATALGRAGVVFGHDLTTEAALTKLSFLLALPGLDYKDIVSQMELSLRGEITEEHSTSFSHPADTPVASQQSAFTALGYAITKGDVDAVIGLLEGDKFELLQAKDYAENTALHLAAVGPDSRVLKELLKRGASVHVRNLAGHTPLWLAQKVGNVSNVEMLTEVGALLHPDEVERRAMKGLMGDGGDSGGTSDAESIGTGLGYKIGLATENQKLKG